MEEVMNGLGYLTLPELKQLVLIVQAEIRRKEYQKTLAEALMNAK